MTATWMGLHIHIEAGKIPAILRHGPRSMVLSPSEAYGLASMDSKVMTAILEERKSYEMARAA